MKPNILVNRYAKAFLDLAIQNGVVDKVLGDLLLVKTTFKENKELDLLVHQPFVSKLHKTNIITKIFKDRVDVITLNLVNLLIEKNREEIIDDIYDEYYELYLEYKKIAVVTVTSAIDLDENTTDRIVNIMRHKIVDKDTVQVKKVICCAIWKCRVQPCLRIWSAWDFALTARELPSTVRAWVR